MTLVTDSLDFFFAWALPAVAVASTITALVFGWTPLLGWLAVFCAIGVPLRVAAWRKNS